MKMTLENIGNELAANLKDRDVVVGKVVVDDNDAFYPIIRLYYTDEIDEEEVDDIIEFIREELNKFDLNNVYNEDANKYFSYEVSAIQDDWSSFNIYLQ